jgi:hypothetical protein
MRLEYMDSSLFDWLTWRSGNPLDLGIKHCRYGNVVRFRDAIKRHAIGYCHGENLPCRPKLNTKAVMFYKEGVHFWFHLMNGEFMHIFEE